MVVDEHPVEVRVAPPLRLFGCATHQGALSVPGAVGALQARDVSRSPLRLAGASAPHGTERPSASSAPWPRPRGRSFASCAPRGLAQSIAGTAMTQRGRMGPAPTSPRPREREVASERSAPRRMGPAPTSLRPARLPPRGLPHPHAFDWARIVESATHQGAFAPCRRATCQGALCALPARRLRMERSVPRHLQRPGRVAPSILASSSPAASLSRSRTAKGRMGIGASLCNLCTCAVGASSRFERQRFQEQDPPRL
jgi:hypothetical protein